MVGEGTDILKNLPLNEWYMPLAAVSGVLVVVSIVTPLQITEITNFQILLISLGTFIYALGEWQNHKYHYGTMYTMHDIKLKPKELWRSPTTTGRIFNKIGFAIIVLGVLHFVATWALMLAGKSIC